MQPSQDGNGDNDTGPLDCSMQGRIFLQCQVRARLIVIRHVRSKNSPQVRFTEDQHPVQARAKCVFVVDLTKNASKVGVSVNVTAQRIPRWLGYPKKQSFHVLQIAHAARAEDGESIPSTFVFVLCVPPEPSIKVYREAHAIEGVALIESVRTEVCAVSFCNIPCSARSSSSAASYCFRISLSGIVALFAFWTSRHVSTLRANLHEACVPHRQHSCLQTLGVPIPGLLIGGRWS
jgi:hypothetical protein